MATTAEYLDKLVTQKNTLADNLMTKGVIATHDETLETLVPKVLDISDGGIITPEKLGYANGAVNFFDGIYNFAQKHSDNGLFWIDLVNDFVMSRSDGSVYSDHYEKNSGINSVFKLAPITYDNFTVEVVFDIKSVSTDECDIAANYYSAGFGVHIENGTTLFTSFRKNSGYVLTNLGEFSIEIKYNVQMVYDGNVFKTYVNGVLIGSQNVLLSEYVKSSRIFALGGLVNGSYCDGAYNFYRFAVYDRALTDDEIVKNYQSDIHRFHIVDTNNC